MNAGLFFSADYRDGRVRIGSKTYPAGHYCVHLLNQYYKDDTAARISVFTNRNWQLQEQLKAGYLNAGDFTKAGEESWPNFFASSTASLIATPVGISSSYRIS